MAYKAYSYLYVVPEKIQFSVQGLSIEFELKKNSMIKVSDGGQSVLVEPKELEEFIQVFRDLKSVYEMYMSNKDQEVQVSDTTGDAMKDKS